MYIFRPGLQRRCPVVRTEALLYAASAGVRTRQVSDGRPDAEGGGDPGAVDWRSPGATTAHGEGLRDLRSEHSLGDAGWKTV